MKKLPLWGTSLKSISPSITAQKRVNCYFELVEIGEKDRIVAIRGTPGLTLANTLPTAPVRGWTNAGNYVYVVAGLTVYQMGPTIGYLVIGTLPSTSPIYNPVSMGINESQIIIVDGVGGYVFDWSLIDTEEQTLINLSAVQNIISQTAILTSITQLTGNA